LSRGWSALTSAHRTNAADEENSGRHRWRLTTSDGRDLATSSQSFATRDDAQRAAGENRH
jgi:hypothetical protein